MSDEVPQSTPQQHQPAGEGPTAPRLSLDKRTEQGPEDHAPWPAPGQGADSAAGRGTGSAAGQGTGSAPVPGSISEARPDSARGDGSVHYQPTLTSLPSSPDEPADAVPQGWAPPAAASAPPAANPFAPPAATAPVNPSAPPSAPANPYAPPSPYAPPAVQHAGPAPVPPPPIAPDGPGQVPYGYPGMPPAYGHPGQPQPPYAGPYGWPGMQPMPSNGMGTASLVLGILASVGFLLWPIALVLGILAVIFGAVGRGKAGRGEATNPGVALAGLICGASGIVLALGFLAFVIAHHT